MSRSTPLRKPLRESLTIHGCVQQGDCVPIIKLWPTSAEGFPQGLANRRRSLGQTISNGIPAGLKSTVVVALIAKQDLLAQ